MGAFEYGYSTPLPYRPIAVKASAGRVTLDMTADHLGIPSKELLELTNFGDSRYFRILVPEHASWIKVEPAVGLLNESSTVKLLISADRSELAASGDRKGAFIIKFADGYSLPVAVYTLQ
jgi:hypothetical protein